MADEPEKDAHAYVEEMRKDVTLDYFYLTNPVTISDERLRELIEIERDRRVAYITAKANK